LRSGIFDIHSLIFATLMKQLEIWDFKLIFPFQFSYSE